MNFKTNLILPIFFICMLFNKCKPDNNTNNIIKINLSSKNTNLKTEIKTIIELETNDSCLIGEITSLKYSKNRFYIFDRRISKTLFVFDQKGKFIGKSKKGDGPGETNRPYTFYIDSIKGNVYLFDQANFKMLEYDLDLNFKKAQFLKNTIIRSIEPIGVDTFLVFVHGILPEDFEKLHNSATKPQIEEVYNYVIYYNNFHNIICKMLPIPIDLARFNTESIIYKHDRILLVAPLDYNIYQLYRNKVTSLYRIDLGNCAFSEEELQKKNLDYIIAQSVQGPKVRAFDNLFENDKYITFSFDYKDQKDFCIFSKQSNESYLSTNLISSKLLPVCTIKGVFENSFICIVDPKDFEEFMGRSKMQINSSDKQVSNPLIVLIKIN